MLPSQNAMHVMPVLARIGTMAIRKGSIDSSLDHSKMGVNVR